MVATAHRVGTGTAPVRRAWLVVMVAVPSAAMAVTWPSWTVLPWVILWVVALFLAALLWETTP